MDTHNATFSPGSEDGPTRSTLSDGRKTDPSGPGPVPVSLSVVPDSNKVSTIPDISGPNSPGSLESAALQQSLASRLRQNLDENGSPEYSLTWKEWNIDGQEPICALRASVRRTGGKGFTGWPTATANDTRQYSQQSLMEYAKGKQVGGHSLDLNAAAQLAGWPTPRLPHGPRARNDKKGGKTVEGLLAGWASPTTRDHKDRDFCPNVPTNYLLGRQVWGIGSPAQMEKRGALNPDFSRWLMGYPAVWGSCGATAMQSCRKSRRNS